MTPRTYHFRLPVDYSPADILAEAQALVPHAAVVSETMDRLRVTLDATDGRRVIAERSRAVDRWEVTATEREIPFETRGGKV